MSARQIGLTILTLMFSTAASTARESYDCNGNGLLDPNETAVYGAHLSYPVLKKVDLNCNGRIDPAEIAALNREIAEDSVPASVDAADVVRARRVTVAELEASPKADPDRLPLTVRDAYSAYSIIVRPDDYKNNPGARASYSRDFKTGENVFGLTGAVSIPFVWDLQGKAEPYSQKWELTAVSFAPSVEFDGKLPVRDTAKSNLSFRALFEAEINGFPWGTTHYVRAAPYYRTDFDGLAEIYGGQIEWQPVNTNYAIGVAWRIPATNMMVRWAPTIRAEYERVKDAGLLPNLLSREEYGRIGPMLESNVWFVDGSLERLSLLAKYWSLYDVTGNGKDRRYFQADALVRLDDRGHLSANARYRKGDEPTSGIKKEDLTLGLSVRY